MRAVRNVLFLGSVLSLAACGGNEMEMSSQEELGQNLAPLMQAAPGMGIQGDYIVKLKDGIDARKVAGALKIDPSHVYSAEVINGFVPPILKLDELSGATYDWGQSNYGELDPYHEPAHVFSLSFGRPVTWPPPVE